MHAAVKAGANAWLRWVRSAFALAAAVAVAVYLVRHWDQIGPLLRERSGAQTALAAALFACTHVVIALAYQQLHAALGLRRSVWQSLDSYLLRLPARYIPGGVWHAGARYLDIHSAGELPRVGLARIFVAENGVAAVSGMLVAASLAFATGAAWIGWLAAAGCALGTALLCGGQRFTRTPASLRPVACGALLLCLNWLVVSFAFALYAGAPAPLATCAKPLLAASYSSAAVTGFLVIVAPQGWGVGEATFALLHPCGLAPATAVATFAGFRVLVALADFALFLVWLALRRLRGAAR